MKLTISNVATTNVKQLAALLAVALDCVPSTSQYEVTDSYEARWRIGYRAVYDTYCDAIDCARHEASKRAAAECVAAMTNPYEARSAEHYGFVAAQRDAASDDLKHYQLTAECRAPDTALFFRLAHSIGATYRTARCTIE
jgi:hypothetical protein